MSVQNVAHPRATFCTAGHAVYAAMAGRAKAPGGLEPSNRRTARNLEPGERGGIRQDPACVEDGPSRRRAGRIAPVSESDRSQMSGRRLDMPYEHPMFLLYCAIALVAALSPTSAGAQGVSSCPPARNLVTVTVTASVKFDPSTKLYTYQYTVANSASSQQAVSDFALDFAPPVSNAAGPKGWIEMPFHGRSTIMWDAGVGSPLPSGTADIGQMTPPLAEIQPGSTAAGFSFQSPNPPGTVNYYALGFAGLPAGETEQDTETRAENCPQSGGGFFDLAVTGTTHGPVASIPPS